MKLRNKKTGEIFDALIREKGGGGSYSLIVCDIKTYETSKSTLDETHFILDEYETLAELNEEWEDAEDINVPIIKDEKIRKCVKLWLEINDIYSVTYHKRRGGGSYLELDNMPMRNGCCIIFQDLIEGLKDEQVYTIAELCGEEEE